MQAHLGDVIYPVCCTNIDAGSKVHTVSLNDENGKAYCVVEVMQKHESSSTLFSSPTGHMTATLLPK